MSDDLSSFSMIDLFRAEAETQKVVLTAGLLNLERDPTDARQLEEVMRAAHSLKGAARIVDLDAAVRVAHVMEDLFVDAQSGSVVLNRADIDLMLKGVDLIERIALTPETEMSRWETESGEVGSYVVAVSASRDSRSDGAALSAAAAPATESPKPTPAEPVKAPAPAALEKSSAPADDGAGRFLRVTAANLNRLLGLAGESLVYSRRLQPFTSSLLRLKRQQAQLTEAIDKLRETLDTQAISQECRDRLATVQSLVDGCRGMLGDRLADIEAFDRRSVNLAQRMYTEALACRMRPFADGVHAFPRMVRDLAKSLGKQARLEVIGGSTEVDRDILEKIEAPITHLLRNAVDHGIEEPDAREMLGKPAEGTIRMEARHSGGMLLITISDDGKGIDPEILRSAVVAKKLTTAEVAAGMSEAELLEFLFLPGFTMKTTVTEISGRGVGLDVVQSMVRGVRGTLRVSAEPWVGTRFALQLPLTVSVVRALIVEIGSEPYALPLGAISKTLKVPKSAISVLEGRQYFDSDGVRIGLVAAAQVFGAGDLVPTGDEIPVVVLGEKEDSYGVAVDRFVEERELVMQPLDARLGKVPNISAGALMEDGSPLLIIDVDDMIVSIGKLIANGHLQVLEGPQKVASTGKKKRVLVVDDSLTVRELERKLLQSRGYEVEVAIDGMDGWNAVRAGTFDLVVSDIDMPRMDGIELVSLIKQDSRLSGVPVMIVSYKDREEDKRRGFEAGADHYLTKGSFHDDSLIRAVVDLIGKAES